MDNMTIPTGGLCSVADSTFLLIFNMFGVADHNTVGDTSAACNGVDLVNVNHPSWAGTGNYGDNSFASADTVGTSQAFFLENNSFNMAFGTDTDSGDGGGGRIVCRWNTVTNATVGVCYMHGTDSTGRIRGGRQLEGYGNTVSSCVGGSCDTAFEFRSGVGFIWGNSINSASAYINDVVKIDTQRAWRENTPWGTCDGSSVWDVNDGTTYYSGKIGSTSSLTGSPWTITASGSPGWTTNEWAPTGGPYAYHDTTLGSGAQLASNNGDSVTTVFLAASNACGPFCPMVGDSYEILRATICMDQPTRGAGLLVTGSTPVLQSTGSAGSVAEVLDPIYEWDDSTIPSGKTPISSVEGNIIPNRDFYMNTLNQGAQNSSTSPFNGTNGTGYGTLAYRPTTCAPGVGYWAVDQGNWNHSSNTYNGGYTEGELFICGMSGWPSSPSYVPYAYPHPLVTGGATCSISPTSIGPFTAGQPVSQQFSESNCTSGGTFTVTSGSLTGSGLSLTSSGMLSGTAVAGSYSFTVSYYNNNPIALTLTTNVAPTIITTSLPNGTVGSAYSQTLGTTGGTPLVSCAVTGSLPLGLNLTGCTISGTPAAVGTVSFSVTPTDANHVSGTAQALSILINAGSPTTCVQNKAIGSFTLCGEAYNDVASGASVTVSYSPSGGNGIIVWASWCFNASCNSSSSGITAAIGDNVNATEPCFAASPHSPFITNSNGGAQGSGDFQQHYVWYCPRIPAGVTSFTITPSTPTLSYLQINVSEWETGGLSASCSPISACFENVDNGGQAGNTTGGTTATITTTNSTLNANDLIFAVTEVPCCSFTAGPGTGYAGITVAPSSTLGMVSEAKEVSGTGVQTATTTWSGGNTPWFGVIVPILAAGSAKITSVPPESVVANVR